MNLKGTTEFIFIGKGRDSFVETYAYELAEEKHKNVGSLYMAIELTNNQADAEEIGEQVFDALRTSFFDHLSSEGYERFEDALKAANGVLQSFKAQAPSRFIGNINCTVSAVIGDALYISTCGLAEVYLVRKKFTSVVSEGLIDDGNADTFVNIANGQLEKGDIVLLTTARLLRHVTKTELGKLFAVGSFNEMGQALSELQGVLASEVLGRLAVLGMYMTPIAGEKAASINEGVNDDDQDGGSFEEEDSMPTSKLGSVVDALSGAFSYGFRVVQKIPVKSIFSKAKSLISHLGIFDKTRSKVASALKNMPEISGKVASRASKLQARFGAEESHAKGVVTRFTDKIFSKFKFKNDYSKEHLLISGVVIVILLIGGIFWLRSSSGQSTLINEQQARLNHVRDLISEASTVGQYDKSKASDIMTSAEQEALSVLNSRFLRADALKVLDEIQSYRDALDDVKRIKEPTVLADLTSKRPNASALGLIGLNDKLYTFEYNALYEMVLDKLQDPSTISDVESVILASGYDDGNSLLFLTKSGKMLEYSSGKFGEVSTKDTLWKKGVSFTAYHDRVYMLDPDRNQIWRYKRHREGFDVGEGYNQDADLKNAVSIAIDSNIYVLNKDGTIIQMYQGQKQEYPLRRSPINPITNATKIFTAPENAFLFILESKQNRVVVYRKDLKNGGAQYQTQYVFNGTGELRDLYVTDNRLYVNDDKKVYFVNLAGL